MLKMYIVLSLLCMSVHIFSAQSFYAHAHLRPGNGLQYQRNQQLSAIQQQMRTNEQILQRLVLQFRQRQADLKRQQDYLNHACSPVHMDLSNDCANEVSSLPQFAMQSPHPASLVRLTSAFAPVAAASIAVSPAHIATSVTISRTAIATTVIHETEVQTKTSEKKLGKYLLKSHKKSAQASTVDQAKNKPLLPPPLSRAKTIELLPSPSSAIGVRTVSASDKSLAQRSAEKEAGESSISGSFLIEGFALGGNKGIPLFNQSASAPEGPQLKPGASQSNMPNLAL